jgi:preprotein translocase subunit YajC
VPLASWTLVTLFAAEPAPQGGGFLWMFLTFILPLMVVYWFLFAAPQRRQEQQRRATIAALKKNDRVLTVGGIYGVVTNVHREADEVTIKVDEATNTKLRVTLGSIARVLAEGPSDESTAK